MTETEFLSLHHELHVSHMAADPSPDPCLCLCLFSDPSLYPHHTYLYLYSLHQCLKDYEMKKKNTHVLSQFH